MIMFFRILYNGTSEKIGGHPEFGEKHVIQKKWYTRKFREYRGLPESHENREKRAIRKGVPGNSRKS